MANNRKIILTADGSSSVFDENFNNHFHSTFGAVQESQHVYINSGLHHRNLLNQQNINVLEVGFGSGLNVLMTYLAAQEEQKNIFMQTIELYPLVKEEYTQLNYAEVLPSPNVAQMMSQIHECQWDTPCQLSENFTLLKSLLPAQEMLLPKNYFNLVYFDAFAPDIQPELWTENVFSRIYKSMHSGGVFVTYTCKGDVRRLLRSLGFYASKIPCIGGKREMLRAIKAKWDIVYKE
ncbi:MAG: tRNA (5-methylaminomethyl-2-thiouridine)(34)-methyltransferase MnmD [Bacteroidales bacterium]|jgi:tRNA U34 5-methylaminomethyl-2-thiouridine-forming methyltransferase MnmC|nr:tRNA (5-methylaminomethyl-2-thiouridine)(34)-methyltransferase MnmD [Bacteroidales bacterium]